MLVSYGCAWVCRMGVLYDYFRAADDDTAIALMDRTHGSPWTAAGLDLIDLKGLDPAVSVGHLVAAARGTDWDARLVHAAMIWSADEDGPWLEALTDAARDTLASITEDRAPDLAVRWAELDDHVGWRAEDAREALDVLTALARRARDAGEHLYCWSSL